MAQKRRTPEGLSTDRGLEESNNNEEPLRIATARLDLLHLVMDDSVDLESLIKGLVLVSWTDPNEPSVSYLTCGLFVNKDDNGIVVISTLGDDGSEHGATYIPRPSILDISKVVLRLNG